MPQVLPVFHILKLKNKTKKKNIFHTKVEMIIQKAFCVRFSKADKHLKSGFYLAYDLQYYLSIRCKKYSDKKNETENDHSLLSC